MAGFLHHPSANVCASGLALLTSESPHDECLHSPSCSLPVSHLVAQASESVILSGCTPVTPYDTSAAVASLLMAVQPSSDRHTTTRAGGRAFPSEGGMVSVHQGQPPHQMEERQRRGEKAGREGPHCME